MVAIVALPSGTLQGCNVVVIVIVALPTRTLQGCCGCYCSTAQLGTAGLLLWLLL